MDELKKLSDNIYKNFEVLSIFCETKKNTAEISNILPMIERLKVDIDKLNNFIINNL